MRATVASAARVCVGVTIYLPGQEPHIPYFTMYARGARLETGRVNARAVMPEVLALVQSGRIDSLGVTECVLPFEDAREAFGEPTLKPVFVRQEVRRTSGEGSSERDG